LQACAKDNGAVLRDVHTLSYDQDHLPRWRHDQRGDLVSFKDQRKDRYSSREPTARLMTPLVPHGGLNHARTRAVPR
jgi:hypothetical protein